MTIEASVVIIVRNGAATIKRQLDALAAQEDAPPFEVLVVDNGSTDDTTDVVRQWINNGIGAATRARIINASERAGIPYARNTGAKAAQGRLILWCDADDAVRPHWVRAFTNSVDEGAAGGQSFARHSDGTPEPTYIPKGLIPTHYLPHASNSNFAINRELLFSLGGYDESLPRYGAEDLELCWRLQEAGFQLEYVADAEVDYTLTSQGRRLKKELMSARARMAAQIRHPKSFGDRPPTFVAQLIELGRGLVLLPVRMLRPAPFSRARRVRHFINQLGSVLGAWTYGVLEKPPVYLERTP